MVPLVCGETLQLVKSKVQHVHSANDLQTTLIVIVSSAESPFLFLNCSKSIFRSRVNLAWIVLPVNIKHNHILKQPFTEPKDTDRTKPFDSYPSRKEEHLCHSSRIMRSLWRLHKNRSKLWNRHHIRFLVATCSRQKAEVCLCLFTLTSFKATLSNPADVKLFGSFLFPSYYSSALHVSTLSPLGTIN